MASVKMVNTIKIFQRICIRIEFSSQRIEIFLFLTTNMVAIVVSLANQRKMDLLHNILSAVARVQISHGKVRTIVMFSVLLKKRYRIHSCLLPLRVLRGSNYTSFFFFISTVRGFRQG